MCSSAASANSAESNSKRRYSSSPLEWNKQTSRPASVFFLMGFPHQTAMRDRCSDSYGFLLLRRISHQYWHPLKTSSTPRPGISKLILRRRLPKQGVLSASLREILGIATL